MAHFLSLEFSIKSEPPFYLSALKLTDKLRIDQKHKTVVR